ncbi:MAG: hypothetical protein JST68_02350 [Bacteroidetes bacterium]|nr:hypothetical protein [Bacteroidota bacterium]
MKFLVSILLIALLAFICGLFMPWWTIALAAFAVSALIPLKPLLAFFAGFLGIFLLWGGMAVVIDQLNNSILATKIAEILPLGGSAYALIVVTAFIGGLVGGGGALTGAFLKPSR